MYLVFRAMFSRVSGQRFTLRMLDPNEYYFDDYIVDYFPEGPQSPKTIKGTIKICSKSIVFVPEMISSPIIKISQKFISTISNHELSDLKSLKNNKIDGDIVEIITSSHALIKDLHSPFQQIRQTSTFHFSLLYVSHDKVIPFLQQLNRASQLHSSEHSTMIAMIAHHRRSLYPFKTMFFDDLYEREQGNVVVEMIQPLVKIPGRMVISQSRLYFQPFNNAFSIADVLKWKLDVVREVIRRSYLLLEVGLEMFMKDDKNYFFVFDSENDRNSLHEKLQELCGDELCDSSQTNMTLKWQNGIISNYDYLLYLNHASDRTFNNLSQYPIFPWVLSNYASDTIDLEDPANFRDLSKPIGALTAQRLQRILARFEDMPEPRFMYGSHYSTPGFVTYYLMRSQPDLMICLMGGKFDHPDRIFAGIDETWNNVLHNTADFKELIPQFYSGDGSFLENRLQLNFGRRQNGDTVSDVALPPWASSARNFVERMREALECDHVSANIHHWIDLIFGFKQRGQLAEKHFNLFHYMSYPGYVDLATITDPNERASVVTQILEFGQVPRQIFTQPHPQRKQATVYISPSLSFEEVDGKTVCRTLSVSGPSLDNFKRRSTHQVKGSVTFFGHLDDLVLVGSSSGLLYSYRLPEMTYAYTAVVSNVAVTCVRVIADHTLCVGSADGKFYFLSKLQSFVYTSFLGHYDTITDITTDKGLVFSGSSDSSVKVWEVRYQTSTKVKTMHLITDLDHDSAIARIAVSGPVLAAVLDDHSVVLHNWDTMDHLRTVDYGHYAPTGIAVWAGKLVLFGVSLTYLDLESLEEEFTRRVDHPITAHTWSGDEEGAIIIAEADGTVTKVNATSGDVLGQMSAEDVVKPGAVCYLPHSNLLLIGNEIKNFSIYEIS